MAERYNLCVPQEGKNGKTYWNQVGVMFRRDKGGFSIKLHILPETNIMAFPPKDREENKDPDGENWDPPY